MVKREPVIGFLLFNQEVDTPYRIDWDKAKSTLKNLRIKEVVPVWSIRSVDCVNHAASTKSSYWNREIKDPVMQQKWKQLCDYYAKKCPIGLELPGDFPCINIRKPSKATYLPIELCSLVPLQRYTKALTNRQRASLVENSRQILLLITFSPLIM